MRSKFRIPEITHKLMEVWMKYPDLRLGQLIENVRLQAGDKNDDAFNVEDDVLVRELDTILKNGFRIGE